MEIWPNEVCDTHEASWAINQLEVEASQVQRPTGLATVKFLSRHEVLQVLVVHPDFYWVPGSFQKVPPLFQHVDDSKHLLIIDLIVPFHQRQGFAIESHWLLLLFSR